MMRVGLAQSVEGLNRKRPTFPEEEGILLADCFQIQTETFPGSPACRPNLPDFGLTGLHNCTNPFLNINFSLSLFLSLHILLAVSLRNPD